MPTHHVRLAIHSPLKIELQLDFFEVEHSKYGRFNRLRRGTPSQTAILDDFHWRKVIHHVSSVTSTRRIDAV